MDAKLIALKLVLDGLGESDDISSVSDRLRVQKAVYLTQAAGLNLGYIYSWYVKGPYSPSLTRDYYQLADDRAAGDDEHTRNVLNVQAAQAVQRTRELLTVPNGVNLPAHAWYELLASLHYLMTVGRSTFEDASQRIRELKPHLQHYLDAGRSRLQAFQLI